MSRPALEVIDGQRQGGERRQKLEELYARYGSSVFSRCRYLLKEREASEDAMQEVFAKALCNWSEFRAEASPLTWLMKIATNHCLNLMRSQRAGWRDRYERQEQGRGEADGGPRIYELRDAVRRLLEQLDPESQAAAVHYYVDEMTLEEVAALLGRSVPTIRKRLQAVAKAAGQEVMP